MNINPIKRYELRTQTYTQLRVNEQTTTNYETMLAARVAFKEAVADVHNYEVEVLEIIRVAHMCWDNVPAPAPSTE